MCIGEVHYGIEDSTKMTDGYNTNYRGRSVFTKVTALKDEHSLERH